MSKLLKFGSPRKIPLLHGIIHSVTMVLWITRCFRRFPRSHFMLNIWNSLVLSFVSVMESLDWGEYFMFYRLRNGIMWFCWKYLSFILFRESIDEVKHWWRHSFVSKYASFNDLHCWGPNIHIYQPSFLPHLVSSAVLPHWKYTKINCRTC